MGGGYNSSAYLDMDEEFFRSLETANYECHQSPAKNTTSESTILHKHYAQRRATRTRVVMTLSLMLLAGVGSLALYSSVDASSWAMKVRAPSPMFRGSSTKPGSNPKVGEVFNGDDSPAFENAILASDETKAQGETTYALDDAMLDELDPYDEFRQEGKQIEAN
ncbi:hypothetical protein P3T76_011567 [Phytophthora citrophthora]|uniref:Transmembrane protein n=1 Tax=Phytophthora citrophthora TaxID=4793 RepID=A0AAD9G8J6_9STRA|nr:hypothetical protein P3T76_011567 [Phytophthora citrophthora]